MCGFVRECANYLQVFAHLSLLFCLFVRELCLVSSAILLALSKYPCRFGGMKHLAFATLLQLSLLIFSPFLVAQSSADAFFFRRQAHEGLVLLRNEEGKIPMLNLGPEVPVVVSLGAQGLTPFQEMMRIYTDCRIVSIEYGNPEGPVMLSRVLREHKTVVVAWHNLAAWQALSEKEANNWEAALQLDQTHYQHALVVVIAEEAGLVAFPGLSTSHHLLFSGGETRIHERLAAQVIMGAESCYGRLKKDISAFYLRGNGLRVNGGFRLSYSYPEAVGWAGEDLEFRIDSIVERGIQGKAFPGCQVLIAKEGQVIFDKSYGFHTYEKEIPVSELDLYDLASLTKVIGPLPVLMNMVDEARLNLDAPFASYWPAFYGSDKSQITVREVLAHQAGLVPYISFYKQTLRNNGNFRGRTIKSDSSSAYPTLVYERMYLHKRWHERMLEGVKDTALLPAREYLYSGLSFLIFPDLIGQVTGKSYEEMLSEHFLRPLGASRICYNPRSKTGLENIVPTEYDSVFRNTLVHGYVHDENAAMLGGISGNAGLFANSHDLAKVLQMYLNDGLYGGQRFLSQEVIEEFTSYQYDGNRRGLGFDKPPRDPEEETYLSKLADPSSFGHSGFTGTFFWVDPSKELVVVILSNRVNPSRENRGLYELKIREAIHEVCYTPKTAIWKQ